MLWWGNQSSEPSAKEAVHSRTTSVLQAAILEGQPTKAFETKHLVDMELQDLVCITLVLVLLWFSISSLCPPVLLFGMEMDILCPCMVEACNWFFDLQGDIRDCTES